MTAARAHARRTLDGSPRFDALIGVCPLDQKGRRAGESKHSPPPRL
jgi:hypothetical protein